MVTTQKVYEPDSIKVVGYPATLGTRLLIRRSRSVMEFPTLQRPGQRKLTHG